MSPNLTSGWPNFALLRRDPDCTSHRRFAAAAERKAIDCCYHRLAEILDKVEDRLSVTAGLFCFDCRDMSEFADVRSRDERFVSRSCQDNAAHRSIIPRVLESRSQVLPGSLIESVEHFGAIESHIGDGVLFLVQKHSQVLMQLLADS